MREPEAPTREFIEMRCGVLLATVAAKALVAHIVGHDKNNVQGFDFCGSRRIEIGCH